MERPIGLQCHAERTASKRAELILREIEPPEARVPAERSREGVDGALQPKADPIEAHVERGERAIDGERLSECDAARDAKVVLRHVEPRQRRVMHERLAQRAPALGAEAAAHHVEFCEGRTASQRPRDRATAFRPDIVEAHVQADQRAIRAQGLAERTAAGPTEPIPLDIDGRERAVGLERLRKCESALRAHADPLQAERGHLARRCCERRRECVAVVRVQRVSRQVEADHVGCRGEARDCTVHPALAVTSDGEGEAVARCHLALRDRARNRAGLQECRGRIGTRGSGPRIALHLSALPLCNAAALDS